VIESAPALAPGASAVLAALRGQRGLTVAELADHTGLLPAAVRASVRELAQRELAWRPVAGCEAGRWRLVEELAARP
jgi:DNA-binding MarR family transcriptional regulator